MPSLAFPPGFLWGVATSAFQVEGAAGADGRGPSIWDEFARRPGAIADGSDGAVACDHYRRWREDVALMRDLGVGAYRFSVAWPRVMPRGRGPVNAPGLDFYDRLVDGLLEAGIAPMATLYHWDLPQALQEEGGWGSRETALAFVEYADAVAARLGDRVKQWVTHNEPWCVVALGHEQGVHAPGLRDPGLALRVAHHLLLSHGWAVPVLRSRAPAAELGIALLYSHPQPASDAAVDREAARQFDGFFHRWYLDPLFRGEYPAEVVGDRVRAGQLASAELPFVLPGDLRTIAAPLDFLGVNYYSRTVLAGTPGPGGEPPPRAVPMAPPELLTDMGWEVWPGGLEEALLRLHRDYRAPRLYVTENGAAYDDAPDVDGRIRDERRRAYLDGHLRAMHRAIARGAPVRGYYHWSLLDNFEWGFGFTKRFGLVHVDRTTLHRTPRESAHHYRAIASGNALPDAGAARDP